MLHHPLLFSLIAFNFSQTVQSGDVVWVNPPAAGPDNQYASNLAWQIGSTQTLSWQSSYPTATVLLNQQHLDAVPRFNTIVRFNTTAEALQDTEFAWVVNLGSLDLKATNTLPFFYFSLNASDASGNNQYVSSHYINITGNDTNELSGGAIAGIVIGILVGIIFLILICLCIVIRCPIDALLAVFGLLFFGPKRSRNISNIEERTNTFYTGQSSVLSASGDISRDSSVSPPNSRRTAREDVAEYRMEKPRRVREPRYGLNKQRSRPPAAHTQLTSLHAYLASEADTEDFIQMARRDRGRGAEGGTRREAP